MKKIILLTLTLFIATLVQGQSDYESYMSSGVASMMNEDYKAAEKTFRAAKKAARKNKDSDTRKKFDKIVKKVNRYQDYSKVFRPAKQKVDAFNLKEGIIALRATKTALNKAMSIDVPELEEVDATINKRLQQLIADTDAERLKTIETEVEKGEAYLADKSYLLAEQCLKKAIDFMFEREMIGHKAFPLISEARAGKALEAGDASTASGDYITAYKKYKEARGYNSNMEGLSDKIVTAKSQVCTYYGGSVTTLVNMGKKQVNEGKTLATECGCDYNVTGNIRKASKYFELMSDAQSMANKQSVEDKERALAKYKAAQEIAGTSNVESKISSLNRKISTQKQAQAAETARIASEKQAEEERIAKEQAANARKIQKDADKAAARKKEEESKPKPYYRYVIKPKTGGAIDIFEQRMENYTNIHLWSTHRKSSQQFEMVEIGNNAVGFKSMHSNRYLDIHGGKIDNGTNIIQHTGNKGSAQQFIIESAGNSYYRIKSKINPDYCIEVQGGNSANGTNIRLGRVSSSKPGQLFKFEKMGKASYNNLTVYCNKNYAGHKVYVRNTSTGKETARFSNSSGKATFELYIHATFNIYVNTCSREQGCTNYKLLKENVKFGQADDKTLYLR